MPTTILMAQSHDSLPARAAKPQAITQMMAMVRVRPPVKMSSTLSPTSSHGAAKAISGARASTPMAKAIMKAMALPLA